MTQDIIKQTNRGTKNPSPLPYRQNDEDVTDFCFEGSLYWLTLCIKRVFKFVLGQLDIILYYQPLSSELLKEYFGIILAQMAGIRGKYAST